MHAEVMAIGDELTSGQRLNTNSQWLSQRLAQQGVETCFHTTVADHLAPMTAAFRVAIERSDLVLVTGGLGPTADDLTRQALAEAAGVPLRLDESSLRHIEALFAKRGREMLESNRVQALFPEGSRPVTNPHGSAPGIFFEIKKTGGSKCRVIALPGVPAEMREMWHHSVAAEIAALVDSSEIIHHRSVKCFGEGESSIEARLPDLIRRGREPAVGITVHAATITLRVTARGDSVEQCESRMQPTIESIYQCLGDLIFGTEDEELQHAVVRLLQQRNQTLATAECGTSGRISHWLSDLPDAVGVFRGGMVSAADTSADLVAAGRGIAENGAISCRQQFGADFGLAIGPLSASSGQQDDPAEFFYALASADGVELRSGSAAGHPDILKDRAAKQALNLLRLHLLQNPTVSPAHPPANDQS